ncbi:hypothetical protein M5D96_010758, partial [Drosophila gunungcola]
APRSSRCRPYFYISTRSTKRYYFLHLNRSALRSLQKVTTRYSQHHAVRKLEQKPAQKLSAAGKSVCDPPELGVTPINSFLYLNKKK